MKTGDKGGGGKTAAMLAAVLMMAQGCGGVAVDLQSGGSRQAWQARLVATSMPRTVTIPQGGGLSGIPEAPRAVESLKGRRWLLITVGLVPPRPDAHIFLLHGCRENERPDGPVIVLANGDTAYAPEYFDVGASPQFQSTRRPSETSDAAGNLLWFASVNEANACFRTALEFPRPEPMQVSLLYSIPAAETRLTLRLE